MGGLVVPVPGLHYFGAWLTGIPTVGERSMSINQYKLGSVVSALVLAVAVSGGAWAAGQSGAAASAAAKPTAETQHKAKAHHEHHASARVEAVQKALNQHGAKVKVDGHDGPATRAALKKFQSDNGLKANGQMDKATLEKLGVK